MAGECHDLERHRGWLFHPPFPRDWRRHSLYALADWVNGIAFRDIHFSASGRPVIKIAEIKGGISEQTKFTNQAFDDCLLVRSGDLLFSWSGQPETSIDAFWWRGPEGWLNQHVFKVTARQSVDTIFFFYLLRYLKPHFVAIARNKQTTGLGHVTKRDLESMIVGVPGFSEQRAIAHILGTLDDKIELNRKMAATLEAMARALFRAWFVDFEPVRAKIEGRWQRGQSLPGLPAHLYDLFPDRLVDSELGEIPEGWRWGTLGEIADNTRRSARPEDIVEGTAYIALEHMPRRSLALAEWTSANAVESNKFCFNRGDILFGKLRPYFHKVGIAPIHGVCSTDIAVVVPRQQVWWAFASLLLSSAEFVAFADQASTGTKMPRTSWRDMARYPVAIPPSEVAAPFDQAVRPLLDNIVASVHASRTLAAIRDALLPKLVSGELRVKDAEAFLEKAGA
jgi:type I restriction enzyme S subunit